MAHSGSCLCGAVRYSISEIISETGACHCDMCRRWTGGVFLGVKVSKNGMEVSDDGALGVYASSPWAERAFCTKCGTSLWYRVTAPGPMQGEYHVGLGGFDAADGIALTGEIYVDRKPDGYSFAEETHKMTKAQTEAMFAPPEEAGVGS